MWNATVKCISTNGTWKIGETYCIKNGSIDYGNGTFSCVAFESLNDLNRFFVSQFEFAQTPKQMLKSGDKVTNRNHDERWVLLETGTLHDCSGNWVIDLEKFNDDLTFLKPVCDIMKIERGTEVIWEREEKSSKQIEVENIKNEMKKLADRLEQVEKEL